MRKLKALYLVFSLYFGLLWVYVCARTLTINDPGCWSTNFIDGIPVTFWQLGIVAVIISGLTAFDYLAISNDEN